MTATKETPSLNDVVEELPIDDKQRRALWKAMTEHQVRVNEMNDRRAQQRSERPPMLDLLDQARPYAERLVFREGLLPALAASGHDCVDGFNDVEADWQNTVVAASYATVGNLNEKASKAAGEMAEASYILGIAVGLQLRGGGR